MSIKLIYHDLEDDVSEGVSPFDETITRIVKNEDILIASPYLSLGYLQRIIRLSISWRILTDVAEWISSQRNKDSRLKIQEFINKYTEYIHHLEALHAKVIIAGDKAIIGSANFTDKGIRRRTEVSILLDQESQVEELATWFNILWGSAKSVDACELEECIQSMPLKLSDKTDNAQKKLISYSPPIQSKLAPLEENREYTLEKNKGNEEAYKRLVKYVHFAPNREWISKYFDLAKEFIEFTGLTNDDPRLVMSIPQTYKVLPIIINQRYVLAASFEHGKPLTGFIVGAVSDQLSEFLSKAVGNPGRFRPFRDEKRENSPYYLEFMGEPGSIFFNDTSNKLKEVWKKAVLFELNHGTKSSFRKYHRSVVYEAAVNLNYRAEVLGEAFSNKRRT